MIKKYYDYINALAFQCLYRFENKRCIDSSALIDFRIMATNITNEIIDVDEDEEFKKINDFVNKYSDYFEISGSIVKLKDNISYEDISGLVKLIKDRDDVEDEISFIADDFSLLNILGIYTMREYLIDYLKLEESLEKKYCCLFTKEDNVVLRNDIARLLRLRAGFLLQIHLFPEYSVRSLLDTMTDLVEGLDYKESPLNMDLYMKSDFFVEDDDSLADLESLLYDTYQYSIFGDEEHELSTFKLLDEISYIYYTNKDLSDVYEFADDIHFNSGIENRLFYLTYLNKISSFMKEYGYQDSLGMAYNRLLYSLDNIGDKLYIDGNIDKAIEKISDIEIDDDSYVGLRDEMLFMASEIFEVGVNKYTLKKLLMLATFYDITKCEDLIYIIDEYRDNKNYLYFCDIIFGNSENKGYEKKYEL